MVSRTIPVLLASLSLVVGLGCLTSSTLKASSDSSSKASKSLSRSVRSVLGSSSPGRSESEDVEEATSSFVQTEGDLAAFRRELGRIGREHGVSDWETHEPTWWAIGRGLRRAGLEGERLERMKAVLADARPRYMKWIQRGYEAE